MQDGFLTVSVIDNTTNSPIEDATINIYSNQILVELLKLKFIKI